MRKILNESTEVAQWENDRPGAVLLNLSHQITHDERSWPIYAITNTGTTNTTIDASLDYSIFRLKHELNFQWSNGADRQIAKLEANEEGMTVGQLVDDVAAIYEHEFTAAHGVDQANKDVEFASRFVLRVVDGNIIFHNVKFVKSSTLKSFFICCDANGRTSNDIIDFIEVYLSNIQSVHPPVNDVQFWRDYVQFAATGTQPANISPDAARVDLVNPHAANFKKWWKTCLLAISMLPEADRRTIIDLMSSYGFGVAQHGHSYKIASYNAQQAQQNQQQPAAQQEQPTPQQQQQPETVNATIEIDRQTLGEYPNWFNDNKTYVIGRLGRNEFEGWWNAQRPEFKRAVLGTHNKIRYVKFQGTLDDSDSTTRRTQLVIWDNATKDLKIFGQMALPRKQRPLFNVLYAFRCGSARDFIPFVRMANGAWHGHLYSLRNEHINRGRHGMRVLYDPDGYLNALYLARPQGLTLHDAGPGVPQTIGNSVTDDLTVGVPRTQLRPLTQAEQAAVDAQTAQLRQAQEQAHAEQQARAQRIQTAKDEMAAQSQQLKQELPQMFNRPEFKNIVQYWSGNTEVEASAANFNAPKDQEYVVLRFPGTADMEVVGMDEVAEFATGLGIADKIQPILDLVATRFPNAKPMLKFNGRFN